MKTLTISLVKTIALTIIAFLPVVALAQEARTPALAQAASELEQNFSRPPDSARPWVYWFWLNGNVTREGITADLEAMKRVGIGGVLIMEVDQGAPVGPVDFMSDPWRVLFKHVAAEASRLGLEVNMNNDAGWNGSGGPWIKPELSMQKVVFTEMDVEGPKHVDVALKRPEKVADFYRDIAVLAFPTIGAYRIDAIRVKAGYDVGGGPAAPADAKLPAEMIIDRSKIVDLTSKMDKNGRLAWDAPAGKWTVIRFGHTSTGVQNAPAPATGRGLEPDKLSKEGSEAAFNGMMAKLIDDVGPLAGKTLVTTHIDSWENGSQNWTARMREEFKKRRGYDLMDFLPTYTGRVVTSLETSERFLWDLRQTISDLVVENYAGHIQKLANRRGLKLSIEAYGSPTDDQPYAGRADEPMGEFWVGGGAMPTCKEMSSAGHTYGKPIIGAESFTAADQERWLEHPATVKALGDEAFCNGINRFVFHRYAMQPWLDRKPGMTMGPWGLHYERTETWWNWTPAWHQYLARCQYMLRQGRFVADLLYLQPEASPQGFVGHPKQPYGYDNCGAEVVLTRLSVKDGRLTLPDGMSYRLLVLPETRVMTVPLLRKIKELVEAGATVVGPRPVKSPSLTDYPKCDEQIKQLADELWADCDGKTVTEHRLGQGRVICGMTPDQILAKAGVRPDFTGGARWRYIHRATSDAEIYFVSNPQPVDSTVACTFRMSGSTPELWWPDTGRIEPAPTGVEKDGVTTVVLPLGPSGSVFVVFREGARKGDPVVALSHGGKSLWAVGEPPLKVTIRSAEYGVLDDPQKTRDVRAKAQQIVDQGEYAFPVARMAEGDDPAFGTVKTLVLTYEINGKEFTVRGQDRDIVHLTGQAPKIVIEKASYGVLDDPKRTRDVKAKIQHMVDTGESSFEVPRLAQGDDPAYMVVKTVVIEYTVNGKHHKITGTDADTITLVPPEGSERIAEVRVGSNGQPMFEAFKPGTYELKTASGQSSKLTIQDLPPAQEVTGAWEVRFPPNWGAPERTTLDKLASLSENKDPGVKYFSGTAHYSKTLNIPADLLAKGRRLYLDLGKVQAMAAITLNGQELGMCWKPPYRVDIVEKAKPGDNALEIDVVNRWPNRLVGDEQLPEDSERNPDGTLKAWPKWLQEGKPSPTGRFTFTTWRLWKKDSPLPDSGLIGPVTLQPAAVQEINR